MYIKYLTQDFKGAALKEWGLNIPNSLQGLQSLHSRPRERVRVRIRVRPSAMVRVRYNADLALGLGLRLGLGLNMTSYEHKLLSAPGRLYRLYKTAPMAIYTSSYFSYFQLIFLGSTFLSRSVSKIYLDMLSKFILW